MSTSGTMPTAAAILLGSSIIAVAVFLGIGRVEPRPTAEASAAVATPTPTPEPQPRVSISPPDTVARHAREALMYQSPALLSRCPSPAGERNEFVLNVTFDADGNEVAHGITASLSNPQQDLGNCISGALLPLRIPAPGTTTMVEIPMRRP